MSKKYSLLILGTILLSSAILQVAKAQTHAIEKLKQSLQSEESEMRRVDLTFQLAEVLYSHDLEAGFAYANQSLTLARSESYNEGIVRALTSLATYYFYEGNMTEATAHCRRAIARAAGSDWDDYPARTFLLLASVHRVMANFDSSQFYLEKAESFLSDKKNDGLQAALLESRGMLANARAHNDDAIMLLRKSAYIYRVTRDSTHLADVWRSMGAVFQDMALYDSSIYFLDKSQELAERVNDPLILMLISLNRGETNFSIGAFDEAIINYSEALNLLKEHNYKLYYAIALFKIGEVYENEGAYHTAYEFFYNSLKEHEKINSRQEIQRTYTQIGWCYVYQENFALAMENAQRSLTIARQIGDSSGWAQNQNLVGYILYKTKRYDEALTFFEQSIAIRKKIKDWYGYSFSMYNQALTYLELNQREKANDLFLQSLKVDERLGKKMGILLNSNTLGLQYAKEKNYAEASYYLAEANKLAIEIPMPTQLLSNYQNYIFLYEAQKNNAKVISYYKLYTQLKDSLGNEANASRVAKEDALFQLQKKANEISAINKENALRQEMIEIQQREIKFQRLVIGLIIAGTILLAVFTVVIYILYRSYKKTKEKLIKQNEAILKQQEEIQAQSKELKESNAKLYSLNEQLSDKNEEIEVQSEKLKASFDDLENVNNSLEKRVEERTSELNKAYEELETFFYHTSHDFRRPLTTYFGLVELANITLKDEKALQLFEKVRETTTGLDSMLVKLQSIGNVNYHDVVREVDLPIMVKGCLEKFREEIQAKKVEVDINSTVNTVTTNPFLLKIVIENLIENAIQFSASKDPRLEIKTSSSNGNVEITFRDNGQGIDARWQSRIFDMYFRANDSSKGNGLGLYIAKRAIEKIDGTLLFTSEIDKGSCFTIKLPIR